MKALNGERAVIGLGNPGEKYKNTRHNIGFMVLDQLARALNLPFRQNRKFSSQLAELKTADRSVLLIKPWTYMNNTGEAVQRLKNFYKLESRDFLVVQDEIDLAFGKLRLTEKSGSAGHRGIESIIVAIGNDFLRLRIGINNREDRSAQPTDAYVMRDFTAEEMEKVQNEVVPEAIEQIESWIKKNSALYPTDERKA